MSSAGENPNLAALRNLLTSWQVGILFELFKEEDIGINELIMMDCGHIHSLLKDFKMGVQIRFEFNLKQWRQKHGIPLKTIEMNNPHSCCCNNSISLGREIVENLTVENTTMAKTATNKTNTVINNEAKGKRPDLDLGTNYKELDNQVPISPQSVNSNTSLLNILNADDVRNITPLTGSTDDQNHNTDTDMDNLPLQALGELLSGVHNNEPPKFSSKNTPNKSRVNLKKILKASGSRGSSIVKLYHEKNRFTNIQRSELIHIVADYFIKNGLHLPLPLSYNLEREILKLFPTEKLEYYRREKRGKIYAKFSNMKHYTYNRERYIKAKPEAEMQSPSSRVRNKTNEDEINNSVQTNYDNLYPIPESQIVVKEENLVDISDDE